MPPSQQLNWWWRTWWWRKPVCQVCLRVWFDRCEQSNLRCEQACNRMQQWLQLLYTVSGSGLNMVHILYTYSIYSCAVQTQTFICTQSCVIDHYASNGMYGKTMLVIITGLDESIDVSNQHQVKSNSIQFTDNWRDQSMLVKSISILWYAAEIYKYINEYFNK